MKKIFLIRHAKSSWADIRLRDIDRPLNDRGKADAPKMSKMLAERWPSMDLLISSNAKRARKTAQIFAKAYFKMKSEIVIKPELYLCDEQTVTDTITQLHDHHARVAIFGHNPTWTDYVNGIPNVRIDNVPTCGVAVIEYDGGRWSDFKIASTKLAEFYYPKML